MKIPFFSLDYINDMCRASLAPTIISIILLPVLYIYFGIDNVLIAPYMALMYIRMKGYVDVDKSHIKPFFLHLFIGIIASIAGLTVLNALIINLIGGIVLTYLLTDEYNPSSYFPYLMAFVFLQLFPTTFDKIPLRLLAITFSYLVLYIVLKITMPKFVTSKIVVLIKDGFLNVSDQFKTLSKGEEIDFNKSKYELFEICRDMNRVIYLSEKSKFYAFVILFQHLNNITNDVLQRKYLLNDNKEYFKNLSDLFIDINENFSKNEYDEIILSINKFLIEEKFSDEDLNNYFVFLLEYAIEIFQYFKDKSKKSLKETSKDFFIDFKKINHYRVSLNSFKLRFAIRMGILLSLSFTFIRAFHLEKSYWIPMTIFLLLMPFYEESKKKVAQRFKGTIMGIILCSVLFFIFKSTASHIIIIGVSTFLMYSYADFTLLTTYITCYAIGISTLGETSGDYKVIFLRLLYTTISILIVLFANRFILRNKNYYEMENMIFRLIDINRQMVNELKNILDGEYNPIKVRELVYLSYLISGKMQIHNDPTCNEEELRILKAFIFNNNKLTTLLGHESVLLSITNEDKIDRRFILKNISKIEKILNQMEEVFRSGAKYKDYYSEGRLETVLLKNTYVNIQMSNCLIKSEDLLNALKRLNKTIKRNL